MHAKRAGLGLGLGLALTGIAHAGPVYDPTTEFSLVSNPNGVWTYGAMDSGFTTFTPFVSQASGAWTVWVDPQNLNQVGVNTSGSTQFGVAPGELTLHPGSDFSPAVLRFTAPSAGDFDIVGQFLPGDQGSMLVGIRDDLSWLWQGTNAGIFNLTATLTAGDTIDFAVYGGFAFGNTPLELAITGQDGSVPAPATLLLLGTGLAGLLAARHRRPAGAS